MATLIYNEVVGALQEHKGNLSRAAEELGITRRALSEQVLKTPAYKAVLDDIRDSMIDKAEDNVYADVEKGDPGASRFVLTTVGKDRGWVQSVAGMGKDGAITIEIRKFAEETEDGSKV